MEETLLVRVDKELKEDETAKRDRVIGHRQDFGQVGNVYTEQLVLIMEL